MTRRRISYQLGLHTEKEREDAIAFARNAYNDGIDAARQGAPWDSAVALGYLMAIEDLAKSEGVKDLAMTVSMLKRSLHDEIRRSGV